eukprot:TRINITY_DN1774_c0_g1_i4.p1 TRINITY_DN1774_c0_g1~~TRINITY_DN1774_c0_g1_i4.p1  ORF type:complete len:241 (-),score=13.75 TRINITY_DN1774_c0_g1_i4:138-773(-)
MSEQWLVNQMQQKGKIENLTLDFDEILQTDQSQNTDDEEPIYVQVRIHKPLLLRNLQLHCTSGSNVVLQIIGKHDINIQDSIFDVVGLSIYSSGKVTLKNVDFLDTDWHCVYVCDCRDLRLENVQMIGSKKDALAMENCYIELENVHIKEKQNNGIYGIWVNDSQISVKDCLIDCNKHMWLQDTFGTYDSEFFGQQFIQYSGDCNFELDSQ